MALSAVVLPAPLGPMSPRMRPSSIRKSMPSSATVVPNALRRPRASMTVMASSPPLRPSTTVGGLQQQIARAGIDEHAATSATFDHLLVDQMLIAIEDRKVIDPIFGRDLANR